MVFNKTEGKKQRVTFYGGRENFFVSLVVDRVDSVLALLLLVGGKMKCLLPEDTVYHV